MKFFTIIYIFLFVSFSSVSLQWLNNYDKAKEQSKSENKPILLVFSGSDWCKPCIRLEQKVFETTDFKQFADKNLVLLKADFPRKRKNKLSKAQKKHNEALAEKYNKTGQFPLVILLSQEGKVLKKLDTNIEKPEDLIDQLKGSILR